MTRRHRDITVRKGTSERHWYMIAGYLAAVVLGVPTAIALALGGNSVGAASILFGVTLIFVFGGLLVMPALFKDAAYVRDTRRGWRPKWWYYIGIPIAVGILTYPVVAAVAPDVAIGAAFTNLALGAFISHSLYIYRRHKFVGVP